MKHDSDYNSNDYTLLIVESPTVANIIDKLDLSYLTVLATDGYCWIPQYDEARDKMRVKADPGKRDIRNRIRDQSRWATRVIISTDFDASGDAIAYGLAGQLNRFDIDLKRAPLRGLSTQAIKHTINRAQPLQKDALTHRMENRFRLQQGIRETGLTDQFHFPFSVLGLLHLFLNSEEHTHFIDSNGQTYKSTSPLQINWLHSIKARAKTPETRYHEIPPLSTPDAVSLAWEKGQEGRYEQVQINLNQLFTNIPASLESGLISYPRTATRGYYRATWHEAKKYWLKYHEPESFRPFASQPMTEENTAHESIHPLDEHNTPAKVRPFIKKTYYDLYRHIYEYHMDLIQMPESYQAITFRSTEGNEFFKTPGQNPDRDPKPGTDINLYPCLRYPDLIQRFLDYNLLSPSKVGSCMDYLLREEWVLREGGQIVRPGPTLQKVAGQIANAPALKQLINYINEEKEGYIDSDHISWLIREAMGNQIDK